MDTPTHRNDPLAITLAFFSWSLLLSLGCDARKNTPVSQAKKPRPVEVQTLRLELPPTSALVSASVASWKTEQIGFEVGGRIEWVAEPNTDIEGRVLDSDGNLIVPGTPVARVESERFQLQVDTAQAEVERAEQSVNAALIELEKSLPSQMRAAEAEMKLAQTEYERSRRLFDQNAGSQSDVDRDEANYQTARSRIEQLQASTKAKEAEIRSLRLQVDKAQQALRDAQRSRSDCTLYSSFRGQISDVSVVPGSVVSAGQPVATIQMMDPIKLEVEVSGEDSRRLRKRQRIPVRVPLPDGTSEEADGFLYLIDPVADPQTRTFTITLLMLNRRIGAERPASAPDNTPTTDQPWRMDFSFLPGAESGKTYVVEQAILRDADGPFLWRIHNFGIHESMPSDGLLEVSKMRVKLGVSKLPFLGNWIFQQVDILDDSFNPKIHMVAGKLTMQHANDDPNAWDGNKILLDRSSQWMARPGDLVKVDLSDGDAKPGFFVPMDAIVRSEGRAYLYQLQQGTDSLTVAKTEVRVVSDGSSSDPDSASSRGSSLSSLIRVEPLNGEILEGAQYVTRGVHYLRDGEPVRATSREGGMQ